MDGAGQFGHSAPVLTVLFGASQIISDREEGAMLLITFKAIIGTRLFTRWPATSAPSTWRGLINSSIRRSRAT